jgi:Tc toxin complex TcA C-terminal TcB-binding domain
MPKYIVLRLTPPAPTDELTFTSYLNGLTIKVYDVSFGNTAGTFLGSAVYVAPPFPPPAGPPPGGTGIVQHVTPLFVPPFYELWSVATAVIQYDPPVAPAGPLGPEYVAPDLRIEFDRAGQQIFDPRVYYDTELHTAAAFPAQNSFQFIPDSEVAAFVTLPPLANAFTISGDGTPPKFDELLAAVTVVLVKDPAVPVTPAFLSALSIEQCRNIANEIVYGGQKALPHTPESLEDMYTSPTNSGTFTDSHEQNRLQFQGQLAGYYGTADATVLSLTNYVYALAAAEWAEIQTQAATQALVTFPVNPNGAPQPGTTMAEAQLIFAGAPLGLDVPAAYFYALAYEFSTHVTPERRYQMAIGADQQANLDKLTRAVNSGWIGLPAALNPAQAARTIESLNIPAATTVPVWNVANPSANQIFKTDWIAFPPVAAWTTYKPGDDLDGFWKPEALAQPAAFLDLILFALTQGFAIGANSLADEIKQNLLGAPLVSVNNLVNATPVDWQTFFNTKLPGILAVTAAATLPTFTLPGSVPARIAAFISYVQKFFKMGTANPTYNPVAALNPLRFGVPANDLIAQTIAAYAGFAFGMAIVSATLEAAAAVAAPGDAEAQAWAVQTVQTLNELYILSQIAATPAFEFSIMEALFARGFTSREDVLDHAFDNFQQALVGTVAYDHAAAIYANAGVPPVFPAPGVSNFGPINPGCLTDCIPPLQFSPLGPVAYLSEMLKVSERSNCASPFAPPDPGHTILQSVIDGRRGPVETLAVTRANLETPLPLIDIVNESLEYIVATNPAPIHGTVYDTSGDALAGYKLCEDHCDSGDEHHDCACKTGDCSCHGGRHHEHGDACHQVPPIFDALPEYSTPATPAGAATAVEPAAWNKLKADFSTCCLPYDQALDVSRTYLDYFRSCRFEEMRTFRKCITEFVLDPVNQPLDFQTHLWRYPVRIDIAVEYLGISSEEYLTLFNGVMPSACSQANNPPPPGVAANPNPLGIPLLASANNLAAPRALHLVDFLKYTCLTYCEFIEVWRSKFVEFSNGGDQTGEFPDCEPCCLDDLWLEFPGDATAALRKLTLFIRLWRKLQHVCGAGYTFVQLADICNVFNLSSPDFIRRLAAFQMLRDQFRLKLTGGADMPPGATGADRTFLLSLWVGPAAKHWGWAVHHLLQGIAFHAECHHKCPRRAPEFIKLLQGNLDPLSRLAGFDPNSLVDSWNAAPTHTLRLAEILAKVYASNFAIGELLYLFSADLHLDGEDPFPLQDANEADDEPSGLPDNEHKYSLRDLRRKLLDVEVPEKELDEWGWRKVASSLAHDFGFPAADVTILGEHFFPQILEDAGQPVTQQARRFVAGPLVSVPQMWNAPPAGLFQYDPVTQSLWAVLPIADEDVLEQLTRVQALSAPEQQAVQDVYFRPRQILSGFAMLFENFAEAESRLIQERDTRERWHYFRREFRKAGLRCATVARHLSEHVEAATHQEIPEGEATARLILKNLFADENSSVAPAHWENDNGHLPPVTWGPPANGGAFAALLGLTGTGLDGEFTIDGGPVVWRESRTSMKAFGKERDRTNCPVLTIIPSMSLALTPQQMKYVMVRNGLAMNDADGQWLGGAQGFEATWNGVMLIDEGGEYTFRIGTPEEERETLNIREARNRSWRAVLTRGQKTWILLRHHWPHEENLEPATIKLRGGAYGIRVELIQHAPEFLHEHEVEPQRTGFEIKYCGPDTQDKLSVIPHQRLFRISKDGPTSVVGLSGSPAQFLANLYTSSWRDIRRTYQRAFKAQLFSHRFALSAKPRGTEGSELGYMLSQKVNFAGSSCYRLGGVFTTHKADFDFNLLPVGDPYRSPAADDRTNPSPQRTQALFDWWERIFDYCVVRKEVKSRSDRHLWLLFEEAEAQQPADPTSLLRHMGADARHWAPDLHFFQGQFSAVYPVTSADLEDDRWMIRAWHADRWLQQLWRHFTVKDITKVRPDLWASDDPGATVFGEAQTGNANLLQFLCDGLLENTTPPLYDDLRRLDDGLRERGRNALISYLCGQGVITSAKELSDVLLLDVLAGRCERASRIEEAISAVQTFLRRARLGLEPGWTVTKAFAQMWDSRFASYHVWEICKRRELYKENWIDWHELDKAKRIEAFGFLDEQLKRTTLTIAAPGGVDYWPDHLPPAHPGLCLLQCREPAEMQVLPAPREGLDLLATPERDGRPSWITAVPSAAPQGPPPNPNAGLAAAAPPPPAPAAQPVLPFWMECAIRLGTRFVRVASAAYPPAYTEFEPRRKCRVALPGNQNQGKEEDCCVTCCQECGCEHAAHLDEYYFWLVDAKEFNPETQTVYSNVFDGQQNEYYDQNTQVAIPWHDVSQLQQLMEWPPEPMVRLAWCRVHNGEFQQPRRSDWGVRVKPGGPNPPDLSFDGRVADSLYFNVSNSTSGAAGFRYDMVPDTAAVLDPLAVPPAPPAPPPPGGLVAYPFFAYFNPGARLFPWSLYSPSVAVANALRTHCRFEAALKWYELVYNPLGRDNRWALCTDAAPGPAGRNQQAPKATTCCCDSTQASCQDARHRSILLHYLDTLLEWGDAMMRRNSPEAFQQARVLFDTMRRIMGCHPHAVKNPANPTQTVATFAPLFAPINPRLMMLYDCVEDRLALIHRCMSGRRLGEPRQKHDRQYWGSDPVRDGWRNSETECCDDSPCRPCCSSYRFPFLVQRAKELAALTREFGAALLAAFEKGDAEYLASVRTRHERELTQLNLKVRQDQWRDADWQVQALEKSKQSEQTSRRYYANLIANGLNAHETAYADMTSVSMDDRAAANITEGIAEAMDMIPDIFVGTSDFVQLPIGTKLAGLFKTIARITNTVADVANTTASLDLTEASWDRRLQDWVHQVEILDIGIEQTELQILGAERRRHQALHELNIQQRQIEQATEALDLLRDKFTNHAVYLYLQKYTADLYCQMYELARRQAHEAQRAYNFERGYTNRRFLDCAQWDNLHEGLLAGERLQFDLARMEKDYLDLNCREYELTKHISLRLNFPLEFLRLKLTGKTEIELPEWMFDLDYPGQFMRRIRNLSLTIPCISGPYNEVHCRLTLLRSGTRVDPLLKPPAAKCCDCCRSGNGYSVCSHDPRWVTENGALEAIATSSGQNDAGLFEINFHDDRYLPFEFHGAVSRWRIELPPENNYFDMDTLSDLIIHLNYTSREGGERLRHAAKETVECDLPGDGWCLFDLRHEFSGEWELFRAPHPAEGPRDRRHLDLRFTRSMFPFVPGDRELFVEKMALLFDGPESCGCECPSECPCCSDQERASHEIELRQVKRDERRFRCCSSEDWPGLYYGVVHDVHVGPLRDHREPAEVKLVFPVEACHITNAYLLCRYNLKPKCCAPKRPSAEICAPCGEESPR